MFDALLDFLLDHEKKSLLLIFLILVACGLGLPIPEDISIVASGVMVSYEVTSLWKAIGVCMAGVLVGDSMIYWMGRLFGEKLFRVRFIARVLKPSLIEKTARYSKIYGGKVVFIARFLPGLRAPTYFFVGSTKKSFINFLFMDGLAAAISVPVWVYVGKVFGENLDALEKMIKRMKFGSLLLALFFVGIFIAGIYFKNRMLKVVDDKVAKKESEEIDLNQSE